MSANNDQDGMARLQSPTHGGWLFGSVIGGWLVYLTLALYFARIDIASEPVLARAGQFGDMFGAINALFTALAFAAMTWSGFMQRNEMRDQRQQLELQQQEMTETRKVMAQQTFESSFFNLLAHCRELHEVVAKSTMNLARPGLASIGDACRREILGPLRGESEEDIREAIGFLYETGVYGLHGVTLGPYFRALYHLFAHIARQHQLSEAERRQYANLARAHLSNDDLLTLAVNCCSRHGRGFVPYVERFGLLKHLNHENDRQMALIRKCFHPSAFEGADTVNAPAPTTA